MGVVTSRCRLVLKKKISKADRPLPDEGVRIHIQSIMKKEPVIAIQTLPVTSTLSDIAVLICHDQGIPIDQQSFILHDKTRIRPHSLEEMNIVIANVAVAVGDATPLPRPLAFITAQMTVQQSIGDLAVRDVDDVWTFRAVFALRLRGGPERP